MNIKEDVTRPRFVCKVCGRVAYCEQRKFLDKVRAKFNKQHRVVCSGPIEYREGVQHSSVIVGQ